MGPALPSAAAPGTAPGTAPRGAGSEPGRGGSGGDSGRETAAALGGGRRGGGLGAGAGTAGPRRRQWREAPRGPEGRPGVAAAEKRPLGVQMKHLTRIRRGAAFNGKNPAFVTGKEKQTQPASAAFPTLRLSRTDEPTFTPTRFQS